MGIFDNIFGSKKRKEEEELSKKNYIEKLLPYKEYIVNYETIIQELSTHNLDVITHNVNKIIKSFDFENYLEKKYGKELGQKLCTEEVFLGMSEEQFDDHMKYKVIIGKEIIFDNIPGGRTKPYSIRKESVFHKTKTKVLRTNSTKLNNLKRVDYIFIDDQLKEIKKFG
jgi:hypothetical protein